LSRWERVQAALAKDLTFVVIEDGPQAVICTHAGHVSAALANFVKRLNTHARQPIRHASTERQEHVLDSNHLRTAAADSCHRRLRDRKTSASNSDYDPGFRPT
jgi:hypothetical protein